MVKISASLSCSNILKLEDSVIEVNNSGVDFYHYDVVDGLFNNTFVFGDLVLEKVRDITDLPIEVHLGVENPLPYLEPFINAGADYIAVHREVLNDESILLKIIDLGAKPILAYRAETPPSEDDIKLLRYVYGVLKLTVNPGFAGQKLQTGALEHIKDLNKLIKDNNLDLQIQADGNININTIKKVVEAGATIVTGGTSGLFTKDASVAENVKKLKERLVNEEN